MATKSKLCPPTKMAPSRLKQPTQLNKPTTSASSVRAPGTTAVRPPSKLRMPKTTAAKVETVCPPKKPASRLVAPMKTKAVLPPTTKEIRPKKTVSALAKPGTLPVKTKQTKPKSPVCPLPTEHDASEHEDEDGILDRLLQEAETIAGQMGDLDGRLEELPPVAEQACESNLGESARETSDNEEELGSQDLCDELNDSASIPSTPSCCDDLFNDLADYALIGKCGRASPGHKTPSPKEPCQKIPTPKMPCPKTPITKTPSPKTPSPKTPCPKTPSPKTPSPKTPSPKTPSPKMPCPKTPTKSPIAIAETTSHCSTPERRGVSPRIVPPCSPIQEEAESGLSTSTHQTQKSLISTCKKPESPKNLELPATLPLVLTADQLKKAMTGDLVVKLVVDYTRSIGPVLLSKFNPLEGYKPEDFKVMVQKNEVPQMFKEVFGDDWDGAMPESQAEIEKRNQQLLSKAIEKAAPLAEIQEEIDDLEAGDLTDLEGSCFDPSITEESIASPEIPITPYRLPEGISPGGHPVPCPVSPENIPVEMEQPWYKAPLELPGVPYVLPTPQVMPFRQTGTPLITPDGDDDGQFAKELFVEYAEGLFQDCDPYVIKEKPDIQLKGKGGPIMLADLYKKGFEKPHIPDISPYVPPKSPPRRIPTPPRQPTKLFKPHPTKPPTPKPKTPKPKTPPPTHQLINFDCEDVEERKVLPPPSSAWLDENAAQTKDGGLAKDLFLEYSKGLFKDCDPYVIKEKPEVALQGKGGPTKLSELYAKGLAPPAKPISSMTGHHLVDCRCLVDADAPLQPVIVPQAPKPLNDWMDENCGQIPDSLALLIPGKTTDQDKTITYNIDLDVMEDFDPSKPVTAKQALKELLPLADVIDKLIQVEVSAKNKLHCIIDEFDPPPSMHGDKTEEIYNLIPLTPAINDIIYGKQLKRYEQSGSPMKFDIPQRLYGSPTKQTKQQTKEVNLMFEPEEEPVCEVAAEPICEAVAEPICEAVAEPICEAVAEQVCEAVCEPEAEPICEPEAEPICEPEAEPICEPEAEPLCEPDSETVAPRKPTRQIVNQKKRYDNVVSKVSQQIRESEVALNAALEDAGMLAPSKKRIVNKKLDFGNIKSKVDYAVPDSMAQGAASKVAGVTAGRGTIVNKKLTFERKSKVVSRLGKDVEDARTQKAKKIVSHKVNYKDIKSKVSSGVGGKAVAKPTAPDPKSKLTSKDLCGIIKRPQVLADPNEPDPKSKYDIDFNKPWEMEVMRLTEEYRKKNAARIQAAFDEKEGVASKKKEEEEAAAKKAKAAPVKAKSRGLVLRKKPDPNAQSDEEKRAAIIELLKSFDNNLAYDIEYKYMHDVKKLWMDE